MHWLGLTTSFWWPLSLFILLSPQQGLRCRMGGKKRKHKQTKQNPKTEQNWVKEQQQKVRVEWTGFQMPLSLHWGPRWIATNIKLVLCLFKEKLRWWFLSTGFVTPQLRGPLPIVHTLWYSDLEALGMSFLCIMWTLLLYLCPDCYWTIPWWKLSSGWLTKGLHPYHICLCLRGLLVMCWIPSLSTYRRPPIDVFISQWCFSPFLPNQYIISCMHHLLSSII